MEEHQRKVGSKTALLCMGAIWSASMLRQGGGSLAPELMMVVAMLAGSQAPQWWVWHGVMLLFQRAHGGTLDRLSPAWVAWSGTYGGCKAQLLCGGNSAHYLIAPVRDVGGGHQGVAAQRPLPRTLEHIQHAFEDLLGEVWDGPREQECSATFIERRH